MRPASAAPAPRFLMATVTAVQSDGAKWGWPGERVIRYLGDDGSWAWVPDATAQLDDRIPVDEVEIEEAA